VGPTSRRFCATFVERCQHCANSTERVPPSLSADIQCQDSSNLTPRTAPDLRGLTLVERGGGLIAQRR
jgi:hypothetical protein